MQTLWVWAVAVDHFSTRVPSQERLRWDLRKHTLICTYLLDEFDAVARELAKALDHYHVPEKEKGEVLAAFAAHNNEVTTGYYAMMKKPNSIKWWFEKAHFLRITIGKSNMTPTLTNMRTLCFLHIFCKNQILCKED